MFVHHVSTPDCEELGFIDTAVETVLRRNDLHLSGSIIELIHDQVISDMRDEGCHDSQIPDDLDDLTIFWYQYALRVATDQPMQYLLRRTDGTIELDHVLGISNGIVWVKVRTFWHTDRIGVEAANAAADAKLKELCNGLEPGGVLLFDMRFRHPEQTLIRDTIKGAKLRHISTQISNGKLYFRVQDDTDLYADVAERCHSLNRFLETVYQGSAVKFIPYTTSCFNPFK